MCGVCVFRLCPFPQLYCGLPPRRCYGNSVKCYLRSLWFLQTCNVAHLALGKQWKDALCLKLREVYLFISHPVTHRQESYAIAAARTRKANEYKMMKLEKDIKVRYFVLLLECLSVKNYYCASVVWLLTGV